MRRISVIVLTIASVLLMLACVSNQAPTTATPKVGKPLVKRLPAKIEGVELVGGTVRAKSGYQFVNQPNGTVAVARMGGDTVGVGLGGTWSCSCIQAGDKTCSVFLSGAYIWCVAGSTCHAGCKLSVQPIGGLAPRGIMLYNL